MSKLAPPKENGVTPGATGTRARIERAAVELFRSRGVDAVTTREIASASGVSEGALYRHFPGKESLAETIFFAIHARLAQEVAAAAAGAQGIDDIARAIVAAYVRVADEDWALFSYHLLTTHRFLPYTDNSSHLHDGNGNPVRIVETVIAQAISGGALPEGDARLKAAAALGVVLQAALHKIYGRIIGELSDHREALSRAVIAVLKS